jgi:magnesium transporter
MPVQSAEEILQGIVQALFDRGEVRKAALLVAPLNAADRLSLILALPDGQRRALLAALPVGTLAEMFEVAAHDDLEALVRDLHDDLPAVLDDVDDDVVADVIQLLEPAEREETLLRLQRRDDVAALLPYEETSAGGLMSHGYVACSEPATVRDAIDLIRRMRPPADRAHEIYLTDAQQVLLGTVSLRDLIVAPPETPLITIAQRDVHAAQPETDQEEVAALMQRYNLVAVPVVDAAGRLLGVTTADDLVDVLEEEATEDMHRFAGMGEGESALAPVRRSLRSRMPWLLVNLMTAFAAAAIVAPFEGTISRVSALAVLMPIIAGHAGNTGTQVATLVVRGLAVGDVRLRNTLTILRKEVAFGLVHGALAGLLTAALAVAISGNWWLGGVAFLALVLNVIIAGTFGAAIPLALRWRGSDPALASSIWLTTFTDMLGFLMLLGFGTLLVSRLQ